eukprot:732352-Hanusia_phi.AAC.1
MKKDSEMYTAMHGVNDSYRRVTYTIVPKKAHFTMIDLLSNSSAGLVGNNTFLEENTVKALQTLNNLKITIDSTPFGKASMFEGYYIDTQDNLYITFRVVCRPINATNHTITNKYDDNEFMFCKKEETFYVNNMFTYTYEQLGYLPGAINEYVDTTFTWVASMFETLLCMFQNCTTA